MSIAKNYFSFIISPREKIFSKRFIDRQDGYIITTRRNCRKKERVNRRLQVTSKDERHSLGGKFALLTKGALVRNRLI
ncbi:hypothetical protein SD77_0172 [Bacillus badius]|uniref:Uncharacterized protein n=1 Tax=Bacillus badius TaxID=1455 RepID=A0ABR5B012_BACBA|nr:hypothetical protein SD77_0172 [Bacillus badius]